MSGHSLTLVRRCEKRPFRSLKTGLRGPPDPSRSVCGSNVRIHWTDPTELGHIHNSLRPHRTVQKVIGSRMGRVASCHSNSHFRPQTSRAEFRRGGGSPPSLSSSRSFSGQIRAEPSSPKRPEKTSSCDADADARRAVPIGANGSTSAGSMYNNSHQ